MKSDSCVVAVPRGAAGRMERGAYDRERRKQDQRRKAAAVGGGVWEGFVMLKGEKPDRAVDAEIRRFLHEKKQREKQS